MDLVGDSMTNLDACYICATPFQLIGAICLVRQNHEIADLYIEDKFKNADIYAKTIEDAQIFYRVKVIYLKELFKKYNINESSNFIRRFTMRISYLFIETIVNDILFANTMYKLMYVTNQLYIPRIVYMYIQKRSLPTKLIYFDDGSGSYCNQYFYRSHILDKIWRFLLFGTYDTDTEVDKRELYLFSPALCKKIMGSTRTVKKIDTYNMIHTDSLYKIFSPLSDEISEDVIIMDTVREVFSKQENLLLDSVYNQIISICGYENVIIKNHPRNVRSHQIKGKYYADSSCPSEVLFSNVSIDSKILIAQFSTALGTPKIIFEKEPIIISLHHIVRKDMMLADVYFHSLKDLYKEKWKVFIPNTTDELSEYLKEIKNNFLRYDN